MLHPSYTDLMQVVNQEVEEGDSPVVSSRYSIVLATSKRARQIIDGCEPYVECVKDAKPLSVAVAEINNAKVKILGESAKVAEEEKEENDTEENLTAEDRAEEGSLEESSAAVEAQEEETESEGETEEK